MEYDTSTFHDFPRLPRELRENVWALAIPEPCTIEQVWNHSKLRWEFLREIPAVFHACSESQTYFLKSGASPVYRSIADSRPFYLCYELDTVYVRRQFHNFDLSLLNENLRSLQMDWGLEPYWWRGSQQAGPTLLRSFPRLEKFTLIFTISKWASEDGEKETLLEIVKEQTETQCRIEQRRHPEWRIPMIYVHGKADRFDWSIRSMSKSLLPENCSGSNLLYDWALKIS